MGPLEPASFVFVPARFILKQLTSMRIGHKIFLGYMAIVLIATLLVAISLITLSNVNLAYSRLLSDDNKVLMETSKLRAALQRQMLAARTYELLGDPSLLNEYEDAMQTQQEALNKITPLLSTDEDRRMVDDIKNAEQRYVNLAQQSMDLARQGQTAKLISLRRAQGEPARLDLLNKCDLFQAKKVEEVATTQAGLTGQVNDMTTRLLFGAGFGFLIALIASLMLSQGLASPIQKLMRNVQGLSSGDLETAISVKSPDEIGQLATVLEAMRLRLAAAAAQNEALLDGALQEANKLAKTRHDLETANAELEEALATESEARKRMEEISKLKAEFAGMVSHELKTPVSYVNNYATALKEHNQSLNEGQRHEFLTAIQSEAQHLLTLIDDILAISLLESGGLNHRFVETDLRKLADSIIRDQQLTTRRHTITMKGPKTLPVYADPTRLTQVLNNLLSNAVKYSPQGGPIEVHLRANNGNNTALIYVRDHGIGIRVEDVPRLFDRFTRIQRRETMAIPGSGLGLYIAHNIIEAHGGTLSLAPAPGGKGTIAQVTVPLLPAELTDNTQPPKNDKADGVKTHNTSSNGSHTPLDNGAEQDLEVIDTIETHAGEIA